MRRPTHTRLCAAALARADTKPQLLADTVICNPPFGAWVQGADLAFLKAAFRLSNDVVYSLHKRSTRTHVGQFAKRQLHAVSAEVMAELKYDLPATYSHHRCERPALRICVIIKLLVNQVAPPRHRPQHPLRKRYLLR